jgi:hypothetical protein
MVELREPALLLLLGRRGAGVCARQCPPMSDGPRQRGLPYFLGQRLSHHRRERTRGPDGVTDVMGITW